MTEIWEHILRGFTFSSGLKDILIKTAKFKKFPGLENKIFNSRGFNEIRVGAICGREPKVNLGVGVLRSATVALRPTNTCLF